MSRARYFHAGSTIRPRRACSSQERRRPHLGDHVVGAGQHMPVVGHDRRCSRLRSCRARTRPGAGGFASTHPAGRKPLTAPPYEDYPAVTGDLGRDQAVRHDVAGSELQRDAGGGQDGSQIDRQSTGPVVDPDEPDPSASRNSSPGCFSSQRIGSPEPKGVTAPVAMSYRPPSVEAPVPPEL